MALRIILALLAAVADLLAPMYQARMRLALKAMLAKSPFALSLAQSFVHNDLDKLHYDYLLMAVAAVFQVAITLLGLYFAAISVVASTSYRGAFVAVRSLLLEREASRRLFGSMIFLASYTAVVLILLAAGVQMGFWTGLLTLAFSLQLFRSFLKTGIESLAYLDPQRALAEQPKLLDEEVDRGPQEWGTSLRSRLGLLPGLVEIAGQVGGATAIADVFMETLRVFVRFRSAIGRDPSARVNEFSAERISQQHMTKPRYQSPKDYLEKLGRDASADSGFDRVTKAEKEGTIGAGFGDALSTMAGAIYESNQELLLANGVSSIVSAGGGCGLLNEGESFLGLWQPFWRTAAGEVGFTERPDLHKLKGYMVSAPIIGVAHGTFSLTDLHEKKLTEVIATTEGTLREKHGNDLSAALDAGIAWATNRKAPDGLLEDTQEITTAIASAMISNGLPHFYMDREKLQKRLLRFSVLRAPDPARYPSEVLLGCLVRVGVLDTVARIVNNAAYLQARWGEALAEQVGPLIDASLRRGQTEFYEAVAEYSAEVSFDTMVAATRQNRLIQQLGSDFGTDLFDPAPEMAKARPPIFQRHVFSEAVIWAGESACDRAAADHIAPELLQRAQLSVMKQAASWVEIASRFQGLLTNDFVERILAMTNRWSGMYAQGGTLTQNFRAGVLTLLVQIGQMMCESEVWHRDDRQKIDLWIDGIVAWAKLPNAVAVIKEFVRWDRSRWDLYSPAESLETDLKAESIREKTGWVSPAAKPELYYRRPLLRLLAENNWNLNYLNADIFGVILLRRVPELRDEIPQSSKRLRALMDGAGIQ